MTLSRLTGFSIGGIIVTLILSLYAVSSSTFLGQYRELEQESIRRDLQRAMDGLNDELADMNRKAGDWAAWEESYDFVSGAGPAYTQKNLTDKEFSELNVNVVVFINSAGRIVFARCVDTGNGKAIPFPDDLQRFISSGSPLISHNQPESILKGVVSLQSGKLLITSRPILASRRNGPIRGTLIMGRFLNTSLIEHVASVANLNLTALPPDVGELSSDLRSTLVSSTEKLPVMVRTQGREIISGYTILRDIHGKPALVLRVKQERNIFQQGEKTILYFLGWSIAICLVFGLLAYFLVHKLLRSRQRELENEKRYRAVVEQAVEGMVIVDAASMQILEANSAFKQLLGYTSEEVLGLSFREITARCREDVDQDILHMMADRKRLKGEYRYRRKDGTAVDLELSASIISSGEKDVLSIIIIDMSDHKHADEELRRHRDHLEELVAERTTELTRLNDQLNRDNRMRRAAEEELSHRLEFEKLIAGISTQFITLPHEQIDAEITNALQFIGMAVGVDRTYIYRFNNDGDTFAITHEWCTSEIDAQIGVLKERPTDDLPWFTEKIRNREVVNIPSVAKLPTEAGRERVDFQSQRIKSLLSVPMIFGGSVVGFIGFDSVEEERSWSQDAITLLKMVGDIFVNAIERKQAEESLRESEEKYRNTMDSSLVGIYIIQDLMFKYVNPEMARLFGYEPEEMIDRLGPADLVIPEQRDLVNDSMKRRAAGEPGRPTEIKGYRKDGSVFDALVWGKGIVYKGHPASVGTLFDITERKHAEDQLRKLSRAVEQSPAMVVITDISGAIEYVNPKFTEITGYTPAEVVWKNPRFLKSGETPGEVYGELWKTISAGGEWRGEFHNKKKNGELYWEYASISPIKDENGLITHYLAVKEDITLRKEAEEQLKSARDLALRSAQIKSEFLANMSHEIRTPMNGVMGMIDLALATHLTGQQQEYLELARSSADSLLTIINDILDFSKIEAGKLEVEKVPFSFRRTVRSSVETLTLSARKKGLELTCEIPADIPDYLVGDPARLNQILLNLVGNAVKFTESGRVAVGVVPEKMEDSWLTLHFTVSDTGIGIPETRSTSIFDAFTQVDGSTTRKYGGTGLGLSIVKRLIDLMKGRIWVESAVGRGSVFHAIVPFAVPPLVSIAGETGESTTESSFTSNRQEKVIMGGHSTISPLRGLKLLLAEDNSVNQKVVIGILEKEGIQVTAVSDGNEALAAMQKQSFDLVLMDIQMPELDGFEATKLIREKEKRTGAAIPIIALTAHALKGDKERCLKAGMNGYLAKPINARGLVETIARLTQHHDAQITASGSVPTAAATGDYFDAAGALEDLGGNTELLKEVTGLFLEEAPHHLNKLKDVLVDRDAKLVELTAHALKGMAANAGARIMAKDASAIQGEAGKGRLTRCRTLLEKMECEFAFVREEIRSFHKAMDLSDGKETSQKRVLLAVGDFKTRTILKKALTSCGTCDVAVDGEEGLHSFKLALETNRPYDLVCIDLARNPQEGDALVQKIRSLERDRGFKESREVKIIMIDSQRRSRSLEESEDSSFVVQPADWEQVVREIGIR